MIKKQVAATYQQRAENFEKLALTYSKKDKQLSLARICLFVLSLIGFVYLANAREGFLLLILVLLFFIVFAWLIRYHNRIKAKKLHFTHLVQINQDEIRRLKNDLKGFDGGNQYQDRSHPYTGDLDIFGEHSLFQLLNRSDITRGKDRLAAWLQSPAQRETILLRQEAIKELKEDLDWNQNFQAYGMETVAKEEDTETLLAWIKEPSPILKNNLYLAASRVMPMVTLTAMLAYYLWDSSGLLPVAAILVNILILWRTAHWASDTHQKTSKGVGALKAYKGMIKMVEKREFQASLNQQLREVFFHSGMSASKEINKLQYILENFDARGNIFYHILNVVLLLDVYWLLKAARWKSQVKVDVELWFDAINDFEALESVAGFAYANPDYTFPEIASQPHVFSAQALGHCLIDEKIRVSNDFGMQGRGTVNIITGSNMSGKSTFLRTIGINTVLALMGAPVCARQLTISEMQVFTSMRTQDSLEESVSSFYAELRRLRQLLDYLKAPERPVLFMLDEILKGTNSQDRHRGAASLIRQLSKLDASGFVSTHDLELGSMESELPQVKNYSFTSTIEQDEIYFDYKLYEGVCKSFNASKLMAKMGIALE